MALLNKSLSRISLISLEHFDLPARVKSILSRADIVNGSELALALEAYKFMSREDLLKFYAKNVSFDLPLVNLKGIKLSTDVKHIAVMDEYNVLITVKDGVTYVYIRMDSQYNSGNINLKLNEPIINYFYITPYNYVELTNKSHTSWNYEILYARFILEAINNGFTDVHLLVEHNKNKKPEYPIYFRVDKRYVRWDEFKLTEQDNTHLVTTLVEKATKGSTTDLLTKYGVVTGATDYFQDGDISLRVAVSNVYKGFHCVTRIQKISTTSLSIDELGFDTDIQEDLQWASSRFGGLTLITGGINTGKNTTAFAIGNEMHKRPIKITSLESPIEMLMPFSQLDYGGDFEKLMNAVRIMKKQDVNVVFLNEVPDKSVAIAVNDLVNTGLQVVTTTHVNRIWHVPHKLYEFYGEDYRNILTQINMVANQRMFGVQCPHCLRHKLVSDLPPAYAALMSSQGYTNLQESTGCSKCRQFTREGEEKFGEIPGKVQPYMERLKFDDDLVSQLVRYEKPFEMESLIREEVIRKNQALEHQMCRAVAAGRLHYKHLDSIM